MTVDELLASVRPAADPPDALSPALRALWLDAAGRWSDAHAVAQAIDDATGAWIHAYLHRKEGDEHNARYWYRRAGRPPATGPFDDEWRTIVRALTGSAPA